MEQLKQATAAHTQWRLRTGEFHLEVIEVDGVSLRRVGATERVVHMPQINGRIHMTPVLN